MGGATTSPNSETTSGSPRQRDTSCRSIAAGTNGRSASITTAAAGPSGSAEMPALSEVLIPSVQRGLITVRQGNPSSSARARSLSCPSVTSTGSSRAATAVRTARRSTVSPSISRKSLFFPMRLEVPAASRTQPTSAQLMDTPALYPEMQRLATATDREHLGQDANRHLLWTLGAQLEPSRPLDALVLRHAQLLEELLLARAPPAQPQVRTPLRDKRAHPRARAPQRVPLEPRDAVP